jgi:hypothetical protein
MKKLLAGLLVLAAAAGVLAALTEPSDWRYPKMLLTELPKMPFRYFV